MAHNDQSNGYYGKQFIVQYSKLTIVIFLLQRNLIFVLVLKLVTRVGRY